MSITHAGPGYEGKIEARIRSVLPKPNTESVLRHLRQSPKMTSELRALGTDISEHVFNCQALRCSGTSATPSVELHVEDGGSSSSWMVLADHHEISEMHKSQE